MSYKEINRPLPQTYWT